MAKIIHYAVSISLPFDGSVNEFPFLARAHSAVAWEQVFKDLAGNNPDWKPFQQIMHNSAENDGEVKFIELRPCTNLHRKDIIFQFVFSSLNALIKFTESI